MRPLMLDINSSLHYPCCSSFRAFLKNLLPELTWPCFAMRCATDCTGSKRCAWKKSSGMACKINAECYSETCQANKTCARPPSGTRCVQCMQVGPQAGAFWGNCDGLHWLGNVGRGKAVAKQHVPENACGTHVP